MIIGLSGYAQSGKDTVANILVNQYGYQRVAFADKIREFLYKTNPDLIYNAGWGEASVPLKSIIDMYGWDKAKQSENIRTLLQNVGVAARNVFGDDFWIKQALAPAMKYKNIVVTDVRFENEANIIKHFDGQIWRVKRLGVTAVNAHVSETEMDNYKVDQIFVNNGTIEDLSATVKARMVDLLV